jgi:2-keto-4-pentenoate hydratase/2-oxohepta-3-ene-1,7-dioic acid hydratase in catechol pathway
MSVNVRDSGATQRTDGDLPLWRGQRQWFEIWFAVVLDEDRRRALWIRQTTFASKSGKTRASIWGAWFDADATPSARAAKRIESIEAARPGEDGKLIVIDDSWLARDGAAGRVEGLQWEVSWSGGKPVGGDLPAWLPAPTHAHTFAHDADATAKVTVGDKTTDLRGRAIAMHLWGKRRVPTLQWIWTPYLGDASLEVTAISLRDSIALGMSSLALDFADPKQRVAGSPATSAHPHGLVTATLTGARRLVHARAWAEPSAMVGYAYRDTDDRDLMVAQSDIGSAYLESFTRTAPGMPWKPVGERRLDGGVAVEIHQRTPLPGVGYINWDATSRERGNTQQMAALRTDQVAWPELRAIVALGLTYAGHVKEVGGKLEDGAPPVAFAKHARAFAADAGTVRAPTSDEVVAALDEVEPGLGAELARRLAVVPAVLDYEGEVAVVALGDIDDDALAGGRPQPFGLAAVNDVTARVVQVLGDGRDNIYDYWARAKSFARFLPVAERVWAPDGGLVTIPELTIETRVNGERRQRASTTELVYDLLAIVRAARALLGRPLARGDVIATGTPAGIGMRLGPLKRRLAGLVKDRFRRAELLVSAYASSNALLRPGDVVEVDAGHAGRVRTRIVG